MTGRAKANGGKARRSGWHRQAAFQMGKFQLECDVTYTPSRWDLLLRELCLTEEQVLELVSSPRSTLDARSARIWSWAREHRLAAFVPEAVLDALGLPVTEKEIGHIDKARWAQRKDIAAAWGQDA